MGLRQRLRNAGHSLLIAAGVVVGSGVLFLFLLDNVIMPHIVDVDRVHVPDVRGMSAAEAHSKVLAKGLRLTVRDSVFSETIPVGKIVDQSPRPDAQIKRARQAFIDVSRGRRLHPVPNVKEVSLREARLQIQSHQLVVGSIRYVSSSIPEGAIIDQHPEPGTGLPRSSRVELEVSSGSPFAPKSVPQLAGLSIEVVEDSLRKYEMRLGAIRERVSELLPPGQVLHQDPAGGTLIPRHSTIDVIVSVRRGAEQAP
ncbi:MAG: PASTA domain-containing protein [Candidatus Latescibacterota bacterium]|nr:PASTA domain-containing protein [Candidatus Latescibacterota bacterium]